ncbi:MAG: hypothetical protein SV201_04850 [Pseudomonadota bacterium]|nr:hypothetical protein [Pseudomonadota bacterium]
MSSENQIVIDTRPESGSPFVAPEGVGDYVTWLLNRYDSCRAKDGESHYYFGIGQKINVCIFMAKNKDALLISKGPHAEAVAEAVQKIADQAVTVYPVPSNDD